jgi:hypothetical protein
MFFCWKFATKMGARKLRQREQVTNAKRLRHSQLKPGGMMMKCHTKIVGSLSAVMALGIGSSLSFGTDQMSDPGTAQGETSQQKSQQGLGLEDAGSSNVILGGPEIIIGQIKSIQGNDYMIDGERGQFIRLRVTKDTNMICASGEGAKMSTSKEGMEEQKEIPISPETEAQMKSHDASRSQEQLQALNDPNRQQAEHQMGPPTKDPSKLKDVVGSTDTKANQDIARGSGFIVGGEGGCHFKPGDQVRVEASDMGTATTITALLDEGRPE